MDETEEEDSQASSLRSLGVDRGHIEVSADELHSRPTVVATKDMESAGKGSSIHPLAVPEPRNVAGQETAGESAPPSDLPTERHSTTDLGGPTADLSGDESDAGTEGPPAVDPDSTGPFPAKVGSQLSDSDQVPEEGHTPLPVLVEGSVTTSLGLQDSGGEQASTGRGRDSQSQDVDSRTNDTGTVDVSRGSSDASGAGTADALEEQPTADPEAAAQGYSEEPDSEGEDSMSPSSRKSGGGKRVGIFLLLVLLLGGVGFGVWKSGLLDKKSSSSKSDEDDDEAKSEDAEGETSGQGETLASQEVIRMQDGESYSLKQTEEGMGTSLQLTIDGEVKYVLFGKLEHHSWDGQGTVTIRDIDDSMLRVTVAVEGDSRQRQHRLKLDDSGSEQVCWVYSVEGDELRGVSCD
jgi:hypothetical protein